MFFVSCIVSECGFRDKACDLSDDNRDSFQQIAGHFSRKLVRKRRRRRLRRIRRRRRRKLRLVRRYFRKKRRRRRRYRRRRRRTLRRIRGRRRRRRRKSVGFGLESYLFTVICRVRLISKFVAALKLRGLRLVCQHFGERTNKVGAYPVSKFIVLL